MELTGDMGTRAKSYNWEKLFQQEDVVYPKMVREFSANLCGSADYEHAVVRGKMVLVEKREINAILGLKHKTYPIPSLWIRSPG